MKKILFVLLSLLMISQLALAESFRVSVTIPRIPGVNYFPDQGEIIAMDGQWVDMNKTQTTQQLVVRDGQEVLVKTSVVK